MWDWKIFDCCRTQHLTPGTYFRHFWWNLAQYWTRPQFVFKNPVNFTVTKIEFYKELYEHEDHIDPIYKKLVPTGTPIVMMCQYRSNATFSVFTQPISISMSLSMILSMTPWEHVGDILRTFWEYLGDFLGLSWGYLGFLLSERTSEFSPIIPQLNFI